MPLTLLHTLSGHTDRVWCAAWSPNGKALATCGGDKAIRLWVEQTDAEGQAEFVCKQTHSRTIRCVSWSPNGRSLASAGFDGITAIWERDASSGDFECIATLEGHENEVKWVSWARSGTMLATCSRDKSVWIWAAEGGAANVDAGGEKEFECLSVLNGHTQDVKVAKWHPTIDSMLISASYDNTIKIWTEEDDDWYATETLTGHTSTVWSIALNADGSQMASCSDDGSIRLWERSNTKASSADENTTTSTTVQGSWKLKGTFAGQHSRCIYTVDWSKDGVIASGAADDSICIFGPSSSASAAAASSSSSSSSASPSAVSSPSSYAPSSTSSLAAASTSHPPEGLALWCTEKHAHAGDVNCVVWNPVQANVLCSVGDDGSIKIWQLTQ